MYCILIWIEFIYLNLTGLESKKYLWFELFFYVECHDITFVVNKLCIVWKILIEANTCEIAIFLV